MTIITVIVRWISKNPFVQKSSHCIIITVIIPLKLFLVHILAIYSPHGSQVTVTMNIKFHHDRTRLIILGTISCNIPSLFALEESSAIFPICWVTIQFKTSLFGMNRFITTITYHFVINNLSDAPFILCYIKFMVFIFLIFTFFIIAVISSIFITVITFPLILDCS